MQVTLVDERDAEWEQTDAPYRIFVYRGADNAVTAFDIANASLKDVLEAAHNLSYGDELLWSLAVVIDGGADGRGLAWISGMDYNDAPASRREWERRREMQDRFLSARALRGEPPLLPDGRRLIRLFPEWTVRWPLWESFTEEYLLTADALGLDATLSQDLADWNEAFNARHEDDPLPDGWVEEGWALARRLQSALGPTAEVRPEFGHCPGS